MFRNTLQVVALEVYVVTRTVGSRQKQRRGGTSVSLHFVRVFVVQLFFAY